MGWGLGLNYLNFGDIDRTSLSLPDGGLGRAASYDLALSGGYGWRVSEDLALGAAAKYLRESVDVVRAHGVAFDLGAQYRAPFLPGLTLAAVARHLGPRIKYEVAKHNLPTTFSAGAAYAAPILGQDSALTLELSKPRNDDLLVAAGVKTRVSALALRIGYSARNEAGLGITAGFGLDLRSVSLDYAIVPYGGLGYSHRISTPNRWGAVSAGTPASAPAKRLD